MFFFFFFFFVQQIIHHGPESPSPLYQHLSVNNIYQVFKDCVTYIGLAPYQYYLHNLRIRGASWAHSLNCTSSTVQQLGRWRSVSYYQIYLINTRCVSIINGLVVTLSHAGGNLLLIMHISNHPFFSAFGIQVHILSYAEYV